MSVAARLLQIPIIGRIPDSTSRITDSKSQDFPSHEQIVPPIPASGLPYMEETTSINKQTKIITLYGARSISHYQLIKQFRYLPGDQKIASENIDVLLLENVERQKKNNEMPKGTRSGKTEPDIAFR